MSSPIREVPSGTTILSTPSEGRTGPSLTENVAWAVNQGVNHAQDLGATVLAAGSETLAFAKGVGSAAVGFAVANPITTVAVGVGTTVVGAVAVEGYRATQSYIKGTNSAQTVKQPATVAEQAQAKTIAQNLKVAGGGALPSLSTFLTTQQTITEKGKERITASTLTLDGGGSRADHVQDNLAAFALRGAHISTPDGGQLFRRLYKEITGKGVGYNQNPVKIYTKIDTGDFPKSMVERNSGLLNKSSHYKTDKDRGYFEGIRQFGVDIEGQGHLLFGLRKINGQTESWFQFEGHGLSTWKDFELHSQDLFVHLGSNKGQVGPQGLCAFSEKNGNEIEIRPKDGWKDSVSWSARL